MNILAVEGDVLSLLTKESRCTSRVSSFMRDEDVRTNQEVFADLFCSAVRINAKISSRGKSIVMPSTTPRESKTRYPGNNNQDSLEQEVDRVDSRLVPIPSRKEILKHDDPEEEEPQAHVRTFEFDRKIKFQSQNDPWAEPQMYLGEREVLPMDADLSFEEMNYWKNEEVVDEFPIGPWHQDAVFSEESIAEEALAVELNPSPTTLLLMLSPSFPTPITKRKKQTKARTLKSGTPLPEKQAAPSKKRCSSARVRPKVTKGRRAVSARPRRPHHKPPQSLTHPSRK